MRALEGRSSGSRISRSALPSQPFFFRPFPPPGEALSRRAPCGIERFREAAGQWPMRRSSPVTATGSRRFLTDFPRRPVRTRAADRRPPRLAARGSPSTVMSFRLFTPLSAQTSSAAHCLRPCRPLRCSPHWVLDDLPRCAWRIRDETSEEGSVVPPQPPGCEEFHRGRAAVMGRHSVTLPLWSRNENRGKATGSQRLEPEDLPDVRLSRSPRDKGRPGRGWSVQCAPRTRPTDRARASK